MGPMGPMGPMGHHHAPMMSPYGPVPVFVLPDGTPAAAVSPPAAYPGGPYPGPYAATPVMYQTPTGMGWAPGAEGMVPCGMAYALPTWDGGSGAGGAMPPPPPCGGRVMPPPCVSVPFDGSRPSSSSGADGAAGGGGSALGSPASSASSAGSLLRQGSVGSL